MHDDPMHGRFECTIFVDTNDPRLQESKVNVVADVATPTTKLAKDAVDVGNDNIEDDEDLSRIQRRSKRTKAN